MAKKISKKVNRLETRLLVQCMVDAKLKLPSYKFSTMLKEPESDLRILLGSIATVMDREIKNLAKRMNKKIEGNIDPQREVR